MANEYAGLSILLCVIVLLFVKKIPSALTALLGCSAFAVFHLCTVGEAFSGFSNSVVILVCSMMMVGSAMRHTGLSAVIGRFVVRTAGKNERLFILVGGCVSALMSAFLSNTAVNVMFLTVIGAAAAEDARINRLNLVFPIVLSTMFGGVSTLVGSTTQMTAQGILQDSMGMSLGIFDYTLPGVILFAVFMLYTLTVGYPIGKHIWSTRQGSELQTAQNRENALADRRKLIIMTFILFATVVLFIGNWFDISLVAVLSALACMLLGCVDFKTSLHDVHWSVIFLLAGFLGISKGLTVSGADDLIGTAVSRFVGDSVPPLVIFAVFVVATMLTSNFISNSAAVLLYLPTALALCRTMGMNVRLFTVGIVFAASLSFSSPLANAQMGLVLSAGYRVSDYIRYTWLLDILMLILIIVLFPLLMPISAT